MHHLKYFFLMLVAQISDFELLTLQLLQHIEYQRQFTNVTLRLAICFKMSLGLSFLGGTGVTWILTLTFP
ncbi:hypothetical protein ONA22_02240 [Mycoplasmopsis cynos]|uniref:hypothetical protein n=1 Tax=Mycoplasmopsis cynos TaxID=171284 RepID=UPI0024C64DB6|nr:hypothetical protein [Mycoplasmopsis cynos]WAM03824.1 hypothetical protein ONA22_02240 [Mycoplasmopsis cynos]